MVKSWPAVTQYLIFSFIGPFTFTFMESNPNVDFHFQFHWKSNKWRIGGGKRRRLVWYPNIFHHFFIIIIIFAAFDSLVSICMVDCCWFLVMLVCLIIGIWLHIPFNFYLYCPGLSPSWCPTFHFHFHDMRTFHFHFHDTPTFPLTLIGRQKWGWVEGKLGWYPSWQWHVLE